MAKRETSIDKVRQFLEDWDGEFTIDDLPKDIAHRGRLSNILTIMASREEIAAVGQQKLSNGMGMMMIYEVIALNIGKARQEKSFPCTKKIKGCKEFMPSWFGILRG